VFIANEKTNSLRIFVILSSKEFDYCTKNRSSFQINKMQLEFVEGGRGYYDTVWGTIKGLKSQIINDLYPGEENEIVEAIIEFITGIEQIKQAVI
jgi:hypothetical protein